MIKYPQEYKNTHAHTHVYIYSFSEPLCCFHSIKHRLTQCTISFLFCITRSDKNTDLLRFEREDLLCHFFIFIPSLETFFSALLFCNVCFPSII